MLINNGSFDPHVVQNSAANRERYKGRIFTSRYGAEAVQKRGVGGGGRGEEKKLLEVRTSLKMASFQHAVFHIVNLRRETKGSKILGQMGSKWHRFVS